MSLFYHKVSIILVILFQSWLKFDLFCMLCEYYLPLFMSLSETPNISNVIFFFIEM